MPRLDAFYVRRAFASKARREAGFEAWCWEAARLVGKEPAVAVLHPESDWLALRGGQLAWGKLLSETWDTEVIRIEVSTPSSDYFRYARWLGGKQQRTFEITRGRGEDSDEPHALGHGPVEAWEPSADVSRGFDAVGLALAAGAFYQLPGLAEAVVYDARAQLRGIGAFSAREKRRRQTLFGLLVAIWLAAMALLALYLKSSDASTGARLFVASVGFILLALLARLPRSPVPYVSKPYREA